MKQPEEDLVERMARALFDWDTDGKGSDSDFAQHRTYWIMPARAAFEASQITSLREENTVLRKALEAWQPIESAPKDGTVVLGWLRDHHEIVTWYYGAWVNEESFDGWLEGHGPSHWMPLPAPPATIQGLGDKSGG